jgi:hypothetical protein
MAAVCISNPFNLDEMSRYLARTRDGELDRAFTKGLVDILAANKVYPFPTSVVLMTLT